MSEDMMTRDTLQPGKISFYLAGPPCPSFCPGGAGAGLSDERGRLMLKTVERVLAEQPLTFALENSGALLEKKYITMTNQLLRVFQTAGYKVKARKLDTPQS
jgi:DNA (cytosine-5)-methyltransferase 1